MTTLWIIFIVIVLLTIAAFIFCEGGFKDGFDIWFFFYLIGYLAAETFIFYLLRRLVLWFS